MGLVKKLILIGSATSLFSIGCSEVNNTETKEITKITLSPPDHTIVVKGKKPQIDYPEAFKSKDETLLFAQAIYGEARGELHNEKYLYGIAESIRQRAKKSNQSIKQVLLKKRPKIVQRPSGEGTIQVYQYTCFDPLSPNYKYTSKPDPSDSVWQRCYNIAKAELIQKSPPYPELEGVTNYFVSQGDPRTHKTKGEAIKKGIPSWAYETTKTGQFILEKNEEGQQVRIPKTPSAIVGIDNKKTAYFYSFNDY